MRSVRRLVLTLVVALGVALSTVLVALVTTPATAAYSSRPGSSWVPNGNVYDVARGGGAIYIAGEFTSLQDPATGTTVARRHVAALDAVTGEPLPWDPGANGTVRAIDVAGGTVYFGGEFNEANNQPASRIAAVGADGTPVAGWSASANAPVSRIVATPDGVYVGGRFTSIGGDSTFTRARLARLDPATGNIDRGFTAGVSNGRVAALALSPDGSTLYLGGTFSRVGGSERLFAGAVDATTGTVTSWAPVLCDICNVFDLAADGNRVFAAVGGGGGRVVAYNEAGGVAWQRRGDGDVQAVDVDSGIVYAGGHFGPLFDGQTRHMLVALAFSNGAVQGYRLPFAGSDFPGIWAVLADSSGLHLGGSFRFSGGNPARRYARLDPIVAVVRPQWLTTTTGTAQVSWQATDPSGVDHYEVARRTATLRGGWSAWSTTSTTATETTLSVARGRTTCVRVGAVDLTGNLGAWSDVTCRTTPVDDRALKGKGTVKRLKRPAWFSGTGTRLTGKTSELRLKNVKVQDAAVVVWSCPTCGKLRVYYGKDLARTIKLKAATSRQRVVVLPAPGKAGRKAMTVTLRPANARPVLVDGIAVRPR